MLDPSVETSRLAQPEVITGQHCSRLVGIAGAGAWMPRSVTLYGLQPADQIPCGAPDGSSARKRVRLCQMQPTGADDAGSWLGADLDEVVFASQRDRSADNGVLGGWWNGRATALRRSGGWLRVTSDEPATEQEYVADTPAMHHAACAAQYRGEPCAWIQIHADLRRGEVKASGAPFRPERNRPERTLIVTLRLGPLDVASSPKPC